MREYSKIQFVCAATWLIAASIAQAQSWVVFSNETSSRLVAVSSLGSADIEEKDFACGDLDQDGDIDMVCVRKQPFDSPGLRRNVLFMNEGLSEGHALNGVLVDRTPAYASDSDVPGDQGFLTPTNDRDAKLADVNDDGWLDVITATMLSEGHPKHITHPRIYINKGDDAGGQWLGLRYEDARIPQLAGINRFYGDPYSPNFHNVAVGDVNNDGLVDLYFGDADGFEWFDFNNRLLVNTPEGVFVDVTTTAIPAVHQVNGHSVSTAIADLNLDGASDLISHNFNISLQVVALYNQPGTLGVFEAPINLPNPGSVFDLSLGNLNNDNRPDLVLTSDGTDRYLLNLGNDASGHATFVQLSFSAASQGFGGESTIADFDNDGFNDVIITDLDFCCSACNDGSPAHIYRNLGDTPTITLLEQTPSVIPTNQLIGLHDAAIFDINGDGWNDVVLGRCAGIGVWINQPPCPADITPTNENGEVDIDDLFTVIGAWGPCPAPPALCPEDIDENGEVDIDDLFAVIAAWGVCP